jgi:hypothetical protein
MQKQQRRINYRRVRIFCYLIVQGNITYPQQSTLLKMLMRELNDDRQTSCRPSGIHIRTLVGRSIAAKAASSKATLNLINRSDDQHDA